MRAFIAVEISEEARGEIERLQDKLKAAGADVKWVEPQNLHLTLKFLGEIDETQAARLQEALQPAVSSFRSFNFQLEGIGAFPRVNDPRVLWVGIDEGKDPLAKLGDAVEKCCAALRFPAEERPFSPHLTIGRVRSPKGLNRLVQKLQETGFQGGKTEAREIILFQSTLSPHGPIYAPLGKLPLKANG